MSHRRVVCIAALLLLFCCCCCCSLGCVAAVAKHKPLDPLRHKNRLSRIRHTMIDNDESSGDECLLETIGLADIAPGTIATLSNFSLFQQLRASSTANNNGSGESISLQASPDTLISRNLLPVDELCFLQRQVILAETRYIFSFSQDAASCASGNLEPDFYLSVTSAAANVQIFKMHFYTPLKLGGNIFLADFVTTGFPAFSSASPSTTNKSGQQQQKQQQQRQAQDPLGFMHISGYMAGSQYTQHGVFADDHDSLRNLRGGIENSSVIVFFSRNGPMPSPTSSSSPSFSIVVSPLDHFMSASLYNDEAQSSLRFGIAGNVDVVPAAHTRRWIAICSSSRSIPAAVRNWGWTLRRMYNKTGSPHERDQVLRYLGVSTANGAVDYYIRPDADYVNLTLAMAAYARKHRLPVKNFEFDSFFYFVTKYGIPGAPGLKNWTAKPDIFPHPDAFAYLHQQTGFVFQLHNRHFAGDNVYASNPAFGGGGGSGSGYDGKTFPFSWGILALAGVPEPETARDFWQYFFSRKTLREGLRLYIQDWLSVAVGLIPQLTANVSFGDDWIANMGAGAEAAEFTDPTQNLSIQLCMSYPRVLFSSLQSAAFTQARASNDYGWESMSDGKNNSKSCPNNTLSSSSSLSWHDTVRNLQNGAINPDATPDYYQWRIGTSSLLAESLGLAPSKDSVISSSVWHTNMTHYCPTNDGAVRETRNYLEAASAILSNGPVVLGDGPRRGTKGTTTESEIDVDMALVMRTCRSDGLLLRPSQAAVPVDWWYRWKSFVDPSATPRMIKRDPVLADSVIHFTLSHLRASNTSSSTSAHRITYLYLLAVNSDPVPAAATSFDELVFSADIPPSARPAFYYVWRRNHSGSEINPDRISVLTRRNDSSSSNSNFNSSFIDVKTSNETTFKLFTLIPVHDTMLGAWVLLGELGKFVSSSEQRFSYVSVTQRETRVGLLGAPGEAVYLMFGFVGQVSPPAVPSRLNPFVSCPIGPAGTATVRVVSTGAYNCYW